ncbi:MAG: acyltransferase family protein [Deltaproteobacteria bacterium]|nr:acyltransferase family protein [Deltaproteobacteria bacterium]
MAQDGLARRLRMLDPLFTVLAPRFTGWGNIPDDRPLLFVGNHTIFGVFDVPLLFARLYRKRGIWLRPLGDHAHFRVPLWRDFLARYGVVDGTRDNCRALMKEGECLLVFPGGAREVAKRRNERYRLIWKERTGFVKMAIEAGCTIVPFAAVGVDDAFDIILDADDIKRTPLGALLGKLGVRDDVLLPLARGLGPLPRPERLYFHFCEAVPTAHLRGGEGDDVIVRRTRDEVKARIERGIAELLAAREKDPKRYLRGRIATALKRRR